jgi:hypothetical protein
MGPGTVAGLMFGMMMSTPDDPLLDDASTTRDAAAEAAALRAMDRLSPSATDRYRAVKSVRADADAVPAAVSTIAHSSVSWMAPCETSGGT